jgi:glycosyltransferase involved in cell wall biosynthesis
MTCLRDELARAGLAQEAELSAIFRHDLDRLLCLVGAGPRDHVYLPTAHGREALAVRQFIHELGEDRVPQFHLEFRHAVSTLEDLDQGNDDPFVLRYTRCHRAYFDAFRAYPETSRMRLYTDTEELAADYASLTGQAFDVLPIPFRVDLIPPTPPREASLNILFLGDVRNEKGFHLLPGLVRALREDYLIPGKVRFVIQAGIQPDECSPVLLSAVAELEQYGPAQVQLVGRNGFLAPEEYYQLLAAADIVLCPYRSASYRARSSGVMAEAISGGKPTVVPAGSWLSRVQPPESGETYIDEASFAQAVRLICDDYLTYRARAEAAQLPWLSRHSPLRLLMSLVGNAACSAARAA